MTERPVVTFDIKFRRHQLEAYRARKRFDTRVWHRRSGKTFATVAEQLTDALSCTRVEPRFAFIAPTRIQARAIAWNYFKRFVQGFPGADTNETDLRVLLPRKAEVQLLGAENYDALRGRYLDGVVIDEAALVPRTAWTQVILPALADRKGRATVMGTPAGRRNLLGEVWKTAAEDDEWSSSLLTYHDTGVIDPAEIARLRRSMSKAEFAQEMECSFDSAVPGAYFFEEMAAAERERRITQVRYDATLPVTVAVDLGWSDAMAATHWQQAGTEHHCIRAEVRHGCSIPQLVEGWRSLPYRIGTVVLPPDAKVTELGTGKTRQETFHAMGCTTVIAPDVGLHEGIEQVRQLMPHMWFDAEEADDLVEALRAYRSEYVEVRGVTKKMPLHDWSSHMADCARYYTVGRPSSTDALWADNSHLYAARAARRV